jgi:hypothetical protein
MGCIKVASLAVLLAVEAMRDGFVTYSEGDQGNRTLMYRTIKNGQLGTAQKIVNKGSHGGDIQNVISFDGKMVAFARKNANPCPPKGGQWNGNGEDDYHKFHCWSIMVARLDQTMPATPAKVVDEGYWPSWGDNSTGESKTLYYGVWTKGEVWKATVSSSGAVSNVMKHASVPGWASGDHHMQVAPNGKLLAIRYGGGVSVVGLNGFSHNKGIGGGCHPSWCSDSYWLYHATHWVGNINGGAANGNGGAYHWGSSYNMKWAISITNFGNNAQNNGWPVQFASMQKATSSLTIGKYDSPLVTSKGNFPDIHENTATTSTEPANKVDKRTAQMYSIDCMTGNTQRLTVNMHTPYVVELFDLTGASVARHTGNSPRVIHLHNHVRAGTYLLKLQSGSMSATEQIVLQ